MTGIDERTDRLPTRGWPLAGLTLLLLLALFYVYGAVNDLVADAGQGLPGDHRGTFSALTGTNFAHIKVTTPGIANYLTLLERGYALHELTFAFLFIALLMIPFRRRQRWAWWAAWILMIANLGYTFTFGIHDSTVLGRSLIADIALPVLLLAHIPAFFGRHPKGRSRFGSTPQETSP
jgi:hypothetical protein